ncbi:MAG: aliphatic sulfonates transporter permease protein SsuC [Firmicutes bacterium]|nr:aliphatic sulfonates transporter permease protein SsuC [Bacillota bacterium]
MKGVELKIAMKLKTLKNVINYISFPILILIIWEIVVRLKIVPLMILPSIESIADTFIDEATSGQLLADVTISLRRVMEGYLIAVVLGISFGVFMGISSRVNKFFSLVFDGIRQIPPMAWIPLLILWFGIGETSKVVIIVKSAFFPILLNTMSGIKNTPKDYIEVAMLHNITKFDLFRKVYFPAAIPSIFVGLRLGLGVSWTVVVAAELIAATSGIGYRISDARSLMRADLVIVGMIVIGAVGVLMDNALTNISKHMIRWQKA